ncbi:myosin-11-like [Chenopodium quinoa]|uniref:myosin-11-like n=1 Tax=Chenopodium quinoa TaxID=63459 RepID=UPI000B79796B|nr:myosin-11-like [Chenopodium quinoa]
MLPISFVGAPLEMTKRRWKEFMQALYENHFDFRKDEELEKSKTDVENKLPKIIKLVKERRQNRRNRNAEVLLRKESELIGLIEDFHKQYQFVYGQYDDLRRQLSETVNGAKEDEGYFTATSSSDSEAELEKDVKTNGHTHLSREKKSFYSEYVETMNKAQENEKIMKELKEKLDEKRGEISILVRKQKLCQREISGLMSELESELSSFNFKLNGMCIEKKALEQRVENKELQKQVSKLEKIAKERDEEISKLVKNGVDGAVENNGLITEVSKIKGLIVQVNQLKLNVDCLFNAQKSDSEKQKLPQSNNNGFAMHENLLDQVNKMKRDLGFMRKKNTELESNIKKKAQENSEFLSQIDDLKKELTEKAQEFQVMQKEKEDSLVRAKNLELEAQHSSNLISEREKLIAKKEQEKFQLTQEIEILQGKMVKMENLLKEREEQFTALQKGLENGEDDKSAQIMALMAPTNHIEQELELKNKFEMIKIKNNDISKLTDEKESLKERILELEKRLKDRGDKFSTLENDLSTHIVALNKEVSHLQHEKDTGRKLDKKLSLRNQEISELEDEKESLQAKVLELEITLTVKEDQIADLQRKSQAGENEINGLQGDLSDERKRLSERLFQLENQNDELNFKISDQQFILKQQEDTINKLREDCKLMKGRFLQAAYRKMDEVAEEFRKNFEDKLRMLTRRIRVAEQLHAETKESCKKMQEHCQQQHPGYLDKRLAHQLISPRKSELQTTVLQAVNEIMKDMECLISNFESKEGSFIQRLSSMSNEIQVAKNWVRLTMNEIKPCKNHEFVASPFAFTTDDKEQDKLMKEKVKMLEAKVNKEKGDKLRLMKGMYEMQKKVADLENVIVEKDEGLLRLGNEKVEAIRQLCMWVDYRQSRFDQLTKMMLVKKTTKS